MNFKKSLIIGASVLTLAPVASATMVSENISADEITTSQSQEIPQSVMTFEESQQGNNSDLPPVPLKWPK